MLSLHLTFWSDALQYPLPFILCRIFKTPPHGVFFLIHSDQIYHQETIMTVQEMYDEMKEQMLEDLLLGYRDHHLYDDAESYIVEIDYTTQN